MIMQLHSLRLDQGLEAIDAGYRVVNVLLEGKGGAGQNDILTAHLFVICQGVLKLTEHLSVRRVGAANGQTVVVQHCLDLLGGQLEEACRITPGIEAPTIAPLSNPDWVAVKAMIKKNDVNSIMDELYDIGARGIFITEIRACRM